MQGSDASTTVKKIAGLRDDVLRVLLVSDDPKWRGACYNSFPDWIDVAWVSLLESAERELENEEFNIVIASASLADSDPAGHFMALEKMAERVEVIVLVHDDLTHEWALEWKGRIGVLHIPRGSPAREQAGRIAAAIERHEVRSMARRAR